MYEICGRRSKSGYPGIQGMTVSAMRNILRQINLNHLGNRSELCERISKAIQDNLLYIDESGNIHLVSVSENRQLREQTYTSKSPISRNVSKQTVSKKTVSKQTVSKQKMQNLNEKVTQHPMIEIGHGAYKTYPLEPPGQSYETMIAETISEGRSDNLDKKYLHYTEWLLQGLVKYDLFANAFPDNTCKNVAIYTTSNRAYTWPDDKAFLDCVLPKISTNHSISINVVQPGHATMIWIDNVNKVIDRKAFLIQVHRIVIMMNC